MFGPETLVADKPEHGVFHWRRLEPAAHGAPDFVTGHKAGVGEHVEMLHHRRQRHRERLRQFADGQAVLPSKPRQKSAPGRVGQRRKRAVERNWLILTLVVKCWDGASRRHGRHRR